MKTPEDEEFERVERESGWRKRQIEQSEMCSNYGGFCKKEWVGLTDEEIQECLKGLPTETIYVYARRIEKALKDKNT
jgi:hypothetical protein